MVVARAQDAERHATGEQVALRVGVRSRVAEGGVRARVDEREVDEVPDLGVGRGVDERAVQPHALVVPRPGRDEEHAVAAAQRRAQHVAVSSPRRDDRLDPLDRGRAPGSRTIWQRSWPGRGELGDRRATDVSGRPRHHDPRHVARIVRCWTRCRPSSRRGRSRPGTGRPAPRMRAAPAAPGEPQRVEADLLVVAGVVALVQFVAPAELGADRVPDQLEELDALLGRAARAAVVAVDQRAQLGVLQVLALDGTSSGRRRAARRRSR